MLEFKAEMAEIRVRIAPSPTGVPHIGNTRTALFNFLFAKAKKGKFILRIEDTDRERFVPQSQEAIYEILEWLGLGWDEGPKKEGPFGPYIQSQRREIYQEYAKKLIDQKAAYYCFCTRKRLEDLRKNQEKKRLPPKYDRLCLKFSDKEIKGKIIEKTPHTIRFKMPDSKETSWDDLIHGKISFRNELLDDSIILKSDGFPTYHLAVVCDDYLMKITHVLRGDEWISSTPKHILIYQAFSWDLPKFGHFPLILGSDKAKLSKRHGAVSILEYRDQGYLKEALLNFMALLGWTPRVHRSLGEGGKEGKEILTLEEMIAQFDLSDVNLANPTFDRKKLQWFNGMWMRRLSDRELAEKIGELYPKYDSSIVASVTPLVKERLTVLTDFPKFASFFFETPKSWPEIPVSLLTISQIAKEWEKIKNWKHGEIQRVAESVVKREKVDKKDLYMGIRRIISGRSVTPPLFESMEVLGKEKVLERIKSASQKI